MVSLVAIKIRAALRLMQLRHPEQIAHDVVYVGLGDRFDDDRRRVLLPERTIPGY